MDAHDRYQCDENYRRLVDMVEEMMRGKKLKLSEAKAAVTLAHMRTIDAIHREMFGERGK